MLKILFKNAANTVLQVLGLGGYARLVMRAFRGVAPHRIQLRSPDVKLPCSFFGTDYGGWAVVDTDDLRGGLVVSAGAGEDISFDIELHRRYDTRMLLVDPTPRAVEHFNEVSKAFGMVRTRNYISDGRQPIQAYPLDKASHDSFEFVATALWNESGFVRFYEPKDPSHVSHSVLAISNESKEDCPYLQVEASTLSEILETRGLNGAALAILKLDIEGAALEVIENVLSSGMRPSQILVEFDELLFPNADNYKRVDQAYELLTKSGYKMFSTNQLSDFGFIHTSRLQGSEP